MFHIFMHIHNETLSQKIKIWLDELAPTHIHFIQSIDDAHVYIKEVTTLFDWIIIRRLKKAHPHCIIIPILCEKLAFSASIAIDLQLTYLLIEPIQKHKLLRAMRKTYEQTKQETAFDYYDLSIEMTERNSLYYDTLLRNLIRQEIHTKETFIEASRAVSMEHFPNTVLFYQSFALPCAKQKSCSIVYNILREHLNIPIHFLPFGNHLAILVHVPLPYASFQQWPEAVSYLHAAIEQLKKLDIHSFIGVGQTFRNALQLYTSYAQARLARRKPPASWIHVRYFDELPTHESIQQAIQYIESHCSESISIAQVAQTIGFSAPYFGKLFKKETGLCFPEYVSYTRIIQSLRPLRRTMQTLEQIAADTGFNTPNYFSGTFKKIVTLSPSDYRQTTEMLFK